MISSAHIFSDPTYPRAAFYFKGKIDVQIRQGESSGVLSKDQVTSLKKIKIHRRSNKNLFPPKRKKPLTDDQRTQINKLLDDNAKAI